MKIKNYVIGVDFGTDSVRSVIVDASDGSQISAAVYYYPRWKDGLYCNPELNQFRQHPLDYIEGLESTIWECLSMAGPGTADVIRAISIDTTGSSPAPVDRSGTPLALLPGFGQNPNAMFVLWKDHTAVQEAAEINRHAAGFKVNYLQFVGGIYSSEWFWAKLLKLLRSDHEIRKHCYSFVEHCDWIPFLLTGGQDVMKMRRGVCSAGHKALWAEAFGGLPPNEFFASLDPLLDGFTDRLFRQTHTADQQAGTLSPEWASRLGLGTGVIVGIGAFDAHMGAVGGQIEPYHLSRVMGTSTCDMLVAPMEEVKGKLVRGICGQVPGSVIPGMMGLEAGQSAFGDAYAWFRELLSWPIKHMLPDSPFISPGDLKSFSSDLSARMIGALSDQAALLPLEEEDELALDWFNGRRTPDSNQLLKGAVLGLSLGTDAPKFFRAIAEATCFGARSIVERFESEGIPVRGLIGLGGVARKSPFIMQMLANAINMPIRIHRSEQTCAMGAAMFAATAAGIYPRVEDAMLHMGQGFDKTYSPVPGHAAILNRRYNKYKQFGHFIESGWGGSK